MEIEVDAEKALLASEPLRVLGGVRADRLSGRCAGFEEQGAACDDADCERGCEARRGLVMCIGVVSSVRSIRTHRQGKNIGQRRGWVQLTLSGRSRSLPTLRLLLPLFLLLLLLLLLFLFLFRSDFIVPALDSIGRGFVAQTVG